MADTQFVVVKISPVPPRTDVDIEFEPTDEGVVRGVTWRCLDCGWKTYDPGLMIEHQAYQKRYHSRWQRAVRWLRIRLDCVRGKRC